MPAMLVMVCQPSVRAVMPSSEYVVPFCHWMPTGGVIATPGGRDALTASGSIARVHIEGLIRSDNERVEALERLENSKAAAVVVHINSPGGTTAGSEQLYDALVRLKAPSRSAGFPPSWVKFVISSRVSTWLASVESWDWVIFCLCLSSSRRLKIDTSASP